MLYDCYFDKDFPDFNLKCVGLGNKIAGYYQKYNEKFKFIFEGIERNDFSIFHDGDEKKYPEVIIATSGMMIKNTPSYEYGLEFIKDKKKAIIFPGYLSPDSPGYQLMNAPVGTTVRIGKDKVTKLSPNVNQFHLSAHSDIFELENFIREIKPRNLILVHGDKEAVSNFSKRKEGEGIVLSPKNGQLLIFETQENKIARKASDKTAVIVTVGISMKGNFKRLKNIENPKRDELVQFLLEDRDQKDKGAEFYSLYHLLKGELNEKSDLHFISTSTDDCKDISSALKDYYSSNGYSAKISVAKNLDYKEKTISHEGIRNFINEIIDIVIKYDRNVQIVATGGFKPEVAYATLIGFLFKVPVNYIYEHSEELVILPEVPIDFNMEELAEHYEEIKEILNAQNHEEAKEKFSNLPDNLKKSIFEYDKILKRFTYSPFGITYIRAFEAFNKDKLNYKEF